MIPSDACANLGCDATRGTQAKARLGTREEAKVDSEDQRYDRAHARVQALKGFYTHATAYVLVNIGLFVINLLTGGGWWFYWPLLGWGIGLGIHALSVFGFRGGGTWGRDWEERKTRELMDRDRDR
jgi:2TM domain